MQLRKNTPHEKGKMVQILTSIPKIKTMMKHLAFFLFPALFLACRDNHSTDFQPAPDTDNRIHFSDMQVGQSSRYLLFEGESYGDPNNFNFTYFPDTLVLRIVDANPNGYLIEEKLTPGSASLNGANYILNPTAVYQNYWKIKQDTVFIVPSNSPSWPFSHFTEGPFALPLAQFTAPLVDIQGWKTTHEHAESYWTATDPSYDLFGASYPNLNILSDNEPMARDADGAGFAYSTANGIVKTAWYSSWTWTGVGWDLLPE